MNQQTLQILLSDKSIKTVTAECADLGLSDIRLFVTNEVEDKDKIHFLGKGEQQGISLYFIPHVERQLAQILNCEIVICSENCLNEIIKEEVLSNTVSYKLDNKQAIEIFFQRQMLPRSQGEFFLREESLEEQNENEELTEEVFEKNSSLWLKK